MTPMSGGGSGTPLGTPIIGGAAWEPETTLAVPLWRYAERVGYRECAFFGVNHPDNPNYACGALWTGSQRAMIEHALGEAQDELEQEIGYFLTPRWVVAEPHLWASRIITDWCHVIEGGVLSMELEAVALAVNYAADPATLTMPLPGAVALYPESLHLYFAGTEQEVYPTGYTIVAGVITWTIPWCRLVAPAVADTDAYGLDYADVLTWGAAALDVRSLITDDSDQATLISRDQCGCGTTPCTDTRKSACIYVRDGRLGIVEAAPTAQCACGKPERVLLNYKAGLAQLTRQAEDTIIRLAHSKMPTEPCGCDITQALWKRDRDVPEVLTRERINCPFGLSTGAWIAWRFAQTMKISRSRGNL